MDKFTTVFLIISGLCYASALLKIKHLDVPQSIEIGMQEYVILDCDYSAVNEDQLVVKWFYNDEVHQIYQWIPKLNKPQALGMFKDKLRLDYKASNDSMTMYRALYIKEVTPELSGNYTCKVSSDNDEDTNTKRMVIYKPPKSIELIHLDSVKTVICNAQHVYPKPDVDIFIAGRNETMNDDDDDDDDDDDNDDDDDMFEDTDEFDQYEDGHFNVTTHFKYDKMNLTGSVTFICKLTIPGTDFEMTESFEYSAESEESEEDATDYPSANATESALINDNDSGDDDNDSDDSEEQENSASKSLPNIIIFFLSILTLISSINKS